MADKNLKLYVELIAKGFTPFAAGAKVAAANVVALGEAAQRADRHLAGLQRVAAGGLAAIGTVAAVAAKHGLDALAVYEDLGGQFEQIARSKAIGDQLLERAAKFAIVTPFETTEVGEMAVAVLAYNKNLIDLIRTGDKLAQSQLFERVRQYGDIAAAAKNRGVQPSEVINALEKLRTTGLWETEQYARLGLTKNMISDVLGLDSQGNLQGSPEQKWQAAMNALLDMWGGSMEKASRRITGLISTLKDNVTLAWRSFGEGLNDGGGGATGVLDRLNALFDGLTGKQSALAAAGRALSTELRPLFENGLNWLERLISLLKQDPRALADGLQRLIPLVQGLAAALAAITAMRLLLGLISGLGQLAGLLAGGPVGIIGAAAVGVGLIALFNKFNDVLNEAAATSGTYGRALDDATKRTAALAEKKQQLTAKITETESRIATLQGKVDEYSKSAGQDGAAGATSELHAAQAELAGYQSQFASTLDAERLAMNDLAAATENVRLQEATLQELREKNRGNNGFAEWWRKNITEDNTATREYLIGKEVVATPEIWGAAEASLKTRGDAAYQRESAAAALLGTGGPTTSVINEIARQLGIDPAGLSETDLYYAIGQRYAEQDKPRQQREELREQDAAGYRQYLIDKGIDPDQYPYVIPPDWTAGTQQIREQFVQGLKSKDQQKTAAQAGAELAGGMNRACAATAAELGRELLHLPLGKDIKNTGQFGRALEALGAQVTTDLAKLVPGDAAILGKPTGKVEGSLGGHAVWVTKVEGSNIWATDQWGTSSMFNAAPGSKHALQVGYHLTDSILRGAYGEQLTATTAGGEAAPAEDAAAKKREEAAAKILEKYQDEERELDAYLKFWGERNDDAARQEIASRQEARLHERTTTLLELLATGLEKNIEQLEGGPDALKQMRESATAYGDLLNSQLLDEQAQKQKKELDEQAEKAQRARDDLVRLQLEQDYAAARQRIAELHGQGYAITEGHYEAGKPGRDGKPGQSKWRPRSVDYTGYTPEALDVEESRLQLIALASKLQDTTISPELRRELQDSVTEITNSLRNLAAEYKIQNPVLSAAATTVADFGTGAYNASVQLGLLAEQTRAAAGAIGSLANAVASSIQAAAQGVAAQLAAAQSAGTPPPTEAATAAPGAGGALGWSGQPDTSKTYQLRDPATGKTVWAGGQYTQGYLDQGWQVVGKPSGATTQNPNPLTGLTPPPGIDELCPGGT